MRKGGEGSLTTEVFSDPRTIDTALRAARFTASYADPLTDDSDEDNFEDGLDFEGQEEEEDIAGIRRRLSDEAAVSRVGEALNQTLGADRDEEAVPRDHFSPVQVRFPVNAPALRPPAIEENMPDIDIAVENGQDGEKAQDLARSIKVEFDPQDIKFWFSQLEAEFTMAAVKSQWLKKTVMQRNLPLKQREDVKSYLILTKTEAGNLIYKEIKDELLRLYAPKPQDSYHKALARTMVGLPSQLGAQLVDDVCRKPKKFEGCCCPGHVQALWLLQLPINVRSHISNMAFTKDTYKEVFEAADRCYMSAQQVSVAAMSASGSKAAATGLDETLPAFQSHNQQQVAAFGQNNKNKGQGQKKNKNNKNQGQGQSDNKGKKHSSVPDNLAEKMCSRHYRHGASAWFCVAPLTCPWSTKVSARP